MNKKNILYIDDDNNNLFSFKVNLKDIFNVFTTTNNDLEYIINFIKENKIDIVVIDERMPDINGSDLIIKIKNYFPKISYVLTSAYLTPKITDKLIKDKTIDLFLDKPWDIDFIRKNICDINVKYGRIALIDDDVLSNILNSKIINDNLKNVITYDFVDVNFAIDFLTKNLVDLIIIEKNLVNDFIHKIKECQKDTPIYVLTDKFETEFFKKYPVINDYINSPILKSNTHVLEKAIFQTA